MTGTHFTNATGLHESNHYSTARDIALLFEYALGSDLFREIIASRSYTTAPLASHPEGLTMESTSWPLINNGEDTYEIPGFLGGKTGFTNPAGQCLATWAEDASGKTYICVVAGSTTFEPLDAVGDTLTLYKMTCLPPESVQRVTLDAADLPLYEHIT